MVRRIVVASCVAFTSGVFAGLWRALPGIESAPIGRQSTISTAPETGEELQKAADAELQKTPGALLDPLLVAWGEIGAKAGSFKETFSALRSGFPNFPSGKNRTGGYKDISFGGLSTTYKDCKKIEALWADKCNGLNLQAGGYAIPDLGPGNNNGAQQLNPKGPGNNSGTQQPNPKELLDLVTKCKKGATEMKDAIDQAADVDEVKKLSEARESLERLFRQIATRLRLRDVISYLDSIQAVDWYDGGEKQIEEFVGLRKAIDASLHTSDSEMSDIAKRYAHLGKIDTIAKQVQMDCQHGGIPNSVGAVAIMSDNQLAAAPNALDKQVLLFSAQLSQLRSIDSKKWACAQLSSSCNNGNIFTVPDEPVCKAALQLELIMQYDEALEE